MPHTHIKKLIEDGGRMFANRKELESLWQEIALNFYPEMADFTVRRSSGQDFAEHLTTSFPLIARRSLADSLSALLRPVNLDTTSPGVWFSIASSRQTGKKDIEAERWLERSTGIMRRAMYDRQANFVRAAKEGDHSFATFGQCVISIELNRANTSLLYRSWHLKDVVWEEGATGEITHIQRKWEPTAQQLAGAFGNKIAQQVKTMLSNEPARRVDCRHIIISTDEYEQRGKTTTKTRAPWVSIWYDVDNQHVIEEVGSFTKVYIIPRWVTIPGSQYASSPAVMAALPDARLIQAMTLTLLESSEKFADPPMVATQEAVRADLQLYAGGVTWIDAEYDERLGQALRPLFHQSAGQGLSAGLAIRDDVREMISKAFFLDSLSLPPANTKEMTAFEVGERVSEWIRRAMPIFEPMEFEYNASLCEETFELLMRNGGFGPLGEIPGSLQGTDVAFKFESPLHESNEQRKGQKFLEAKAALMEAAQIDPSVIGILNAKETLRDVLAGIGAPAEWMRSEREVREIEEAQNERREAEEMLSGGQAVSEMTKNLGQATKAFAAAEETGAPL